MDMSSSEWMSHIFQDKQKEKTDNGNEREYALWNRRNVELRIKWKNKRRFMTYMYVPQFPITYQNG